jgi:hypothetical protein
MFWLGLGGFVVYTIPAGPSTAGGGNPGTTPANSTITSEGHAFRKGLVEAFANVLTFFGSTIMTVSVLFFVARSLVAVRKASLWKSPAKAKLEIFKNVRALEEVAAPVVETDKKE